MAGRTAAFGTVFLALVLPAASADGQEPSTATGVNHADRPTIGVALSGGGARGLAHIGVLRALEEARIPVDLVTGTSMGAVIGGLYSAGLSPVAIEAAVDTVEWRELLSDTPPRAALDFRRKAEGRRYGFAFEIGLSGEGVRLPGGLIAGQELGLLLRRHTLPVATIDDFDSLPVPFAAVATDIETAEAVVLRDGSLAESIRASMAIPVVFSPIEIDGRLLVDGGLVDDLPVELARRMGADVVIAVDVTPRLETGEALETLIGISDQIVAMVGRPSVERQRALADVVVTPDLEEYGIFSFAVADTLIDIGASTVRSMIPAIDSYALPPEEYAAWRRSRPGSPGTPLVIDRIAVDAPEGFDPRRIRARIELEPGDPVDADRLQEAARHVYAIGAFDRVTYELDRRDDRVTATIRGVAKSIGPEVLRLGMRLVTDSGGADFRTGIVTFTGLAAWRRSRLNALGGEARIEGVFGLTNGLSAELHQPLDFAGRWFVSPSASVASTRQPVFDAGRLIAEYDVTRVLARLDAGRTIGRSVELRAGLARGHVDADIGPGPADLLPDLDDGFGGLIASAAVDRLDDAAWPLEGFFGRAEHWTVRQELGGARDYDRLSLEAKAFATGGATTVLGAVRAGASFDSGLPAYDDFRLGGFLSLSAYGPDEIRGSSTASARVGVLHRVLAYPPNFRGVYLGGWAEAGNAWREGEQRSLDDLPWAATVAIGAETILGPAFIAYGAGRAGRERLYVTLGTAL